METPMCAKCGSTQVQSFPLIYESGLTHTTTSGTASGAGLNRNGVAVGTAKTRSKGVQQTELSKRAAPPQVRITARVVAIMVGMGGLPLALVSLVLSEELSEVVFVVTVVVIVALCLVKKDPWSTTEYPKLLAEWKCRFMCLQCGEVMQLAT